MKSGALGKVNLVQMENHRNNAEGAWVYAIPPDASEQTVDWQRFLGPAPKRAYDPKVFFRWRCWWEYSGRRGHRPVRAPAHRPARGDGCAGAEAP